MSGKVGVVGYVLLVAALGWLAALVITDPSGAQLQLAPVFLAAALGAAAVHLSRRPRARRTDDD